MMLNIKTMVVSFVQPRGTVCLSGVRASNGGWFGRSDGGGSTPPNKFLFRHPLRSLRRASTRLFASVESGGDRLFHAELALKVRSVFRCHFTTCKAAI